MGRKNHNWHPDSATRAANGSLISRCGKCGMTERDDFFSANGRVYAVLQWATPDGRLLAIRPVVNIRGPKTAPPLDAAFLDVPVAGMPECPKTPDAWATPDQPRLGPPNRGAGDRWR